MIPSKQISFFRAECWVYSLYFIFHFVVWNFVNCYYCFTELVHFLRSTKQVLFTKFLPLRNWAQSSRDYFYKFACITENSFASYSRYLSSHVRGVVVKILPLKCRDDLLYTDINIYISFMLLCRLGNSFINCSQVSKGDGILIISFRCQLLLLLYWTSLFPTKK